MKVFIPDLFQKYGGAATIGAIVREFSSALLSVPALRRQFERLSTTDIVKLNLELVSFALGHPAARENDGKAMLGYAQLKLTSQAYEEIIRVLRMTLLRHGFESRDATIAINVLDMHANALLGVRLSRQVTSPFAGVDRRRFPRNADAHWPPPART